MQILLINFSSSEHLIQPSMHSWNYPTLFLSDFNGVQIWASSPIVTSLLQCYMVQEPRTLCPLSAPSVRVCMSLYVYYKVFTLKHGLAQLKGIRSLQCQTSFRKVKRAHRFVLLFYCSDASQTIADCENVILHSPHDRQTVHCLLPSPRDCLVLGFVFCEPLCSFVTPFHQCNVVQELQTSCLLGF